jgi:hypothetical protein
MIAPGIQSAAARSMTASVDAETKRPGGDYPVK